MDNCKGCGGGDHKNMIPLAMVELHSAAQERTIRRLWIIVIILIGVLVATNLGWLIYESQFEEVTTEVTQENEDGYNNYIGNDGDIIYGETNGQDNDPQAQDGRE